MIQPSQLLGLGHFQMEIKHFNPEYHQTRTKQNLEITKSLPPMRRKQSH